MDPDIPPTLPDALGDPACPRPVRPTPPPIQEITFGFFPARDAHAPVGPVRALFRRLFSWFPPPFREVDVHVDQNPPQRRAVMVRPTPPPVQEITFGFFPPRRKKQNP